MTNRQQQIDQLRDLPSRVADLVRDLSAAQLTARPIDGEWSIAQNVHHLADSHLNSYVRCKLIATEDRPTLRPYNEAAWGELPDATSADIGDSLALLEHLHARWVNFWQSLGDEAWQRTGYHPGDDRTVTLADQLRLYVEHGEAHVQQIQRVINQF